MGLQPRLLQPVAGAIGERRRAVRGEAEVRGRFGGIHALDLRVPEDRLPSLGQRAECAGGDGLLDELGLAVGRVRELVVELDGRGTRLLVPGQGDVAHRPVQIRAERLVRAATALQRAQDLEVGLRDDVVGVGDGAELPCRHPAGPGVALPQLGVRARVAGAHARGERVVAGLIGTVFHGSPSSGCHGAGRRHVNHPIQPLL
jgi:hypothetical protein